VGGNRVRDTQRALSAAVPPSGAAQLPASARLVAARREFDGLRQIEFSIAITVGADEAKVGTRWGMEDRDLR
jgi:hypothetical protein